MAFIDTIIKPWKFYRFTFTGATNHLRYVYLSEMRMYEQSDLQGTNVALTGTATSNGNWSSTTTPDKAIDNNPSTGWESSEALPTLSENPRIWTIEFPTAKLIKSFQIECNTPNERPTTFNIDVSDDGTTWVQFGRYTNFFSNLNNETIASSNTGSYIQGNASLNNGTRVSKIRVLEVAGGLAKETNAVAAYEPGTNNWYMLVKPATEHYIIYEGPQGYRPMIDGPIISRA